MKSSSRSFCLLLLLLSLVGLLAASAQQLDTPRQNLTVAAQKAGTCPDAEEAKTNSGNCTEECQSDASCHGVEKCCRTGCGATCRIPNDKPGSCPQAIHGISALGLCKEECRKDSECRSTRKCCETGCGMWTCVLPRS
ncbi:waprin-Phi1-like [Rhineura floridana]|uniref:waprin-Phi1-like n=1 Tax=Rhineura floridana TaxID=261503 RepID=UPI002AC7E9CD|nr:waprin-Phi1-like [Rhineura floridana]